MIRSATIFGLALLAICRAPSAHGAEHIVLLVHGMQWDLNRPDNTWGEFQEGRWTGMIGSLEKQGYRYGGKVRPGGGAEFDLVRSLNTQGVVGKPANASSFSRRSG